MFRLVAALLAMLTMTAATLTPVQFTVPGVDDAMDFHGDPANADLVIFAGGNQWFVMPDLLAAFRRAHPNVANIFYETLPPGVLAAQMQSGSLHVGELVLHVRPDVYLAGKTRMQKMRDAGFVGAPVVYAGNTLAIMVRSGNPKHIGSLVDLGRSDVRVAMPNPTHEGIARPIEIAYRKAGGESLDRAIMQTKVKNGTTLLTTIHHRQTPMWILSGRVDAGPVWLTEALYQEKMHTGIIAVRLAPEVNVRAIYLGAVVKHAPHMSAANAFVQFLATPTAAAIYRSYGFAPAASTEE